jgi:hypothetical protein
MKTYTPNDDSTFVVRSTQEPSHYLRENEERVQQVRRRGLLRRLIPNATQRELDDHERQVITTGLDYQRRALAMAVEARLQAMEEACNHALVTGKAAIRRERQEFFGEQLVLLRRCMELYADQFNEEMDRRFTALERYQNPHLRQREEERLVHAVNEFHTLLERLSGEFIAIVNEGVSR